MWHIPFFQHDLGEEELLSFKRVLAGPILTTGAVTADFEKEFAHFLGARHVIGTSSGTSALELALLAAGVGPGDEVITTPLTFVATGLAIIHCSAKPVFVDVEPDTGNIDSKLVAQAITKRTRAILPVHLYGVMCDMPGLASLARTSKIALIEDSAHCIEGSRDNLRPGALSDAACFSFYGTKNITAGEGGAVIANDDELAEKIRRLSLHGIVREPAAGDPRLYRHWDIQEVGLKANMSNLSAALLLPQMKRIGTNLAKRERLAACYRRHLEGHVGWPSLPEGTVHARHLFTVWVPPERRDTIVRGLNAKGIGAVINYRPIHLLKLFRDQFGFREGSFPNAERIGTSTISLPLYPGLSEKQVEEVTQALIELLC
jgi:dTDP-4-amino-4,6-dideoxygalactose transaminase